MPLSQTTKTDLVFKKIKGRRITTVDKAFYEEFPGALTYLHSTEVWSDTIPVPAPGTTTSVVQYYSDLQMTEDATVSNHRAWLACSTPGDTNTQLKGFVPPRFDQSYTVRVFEDDGAGNLDSSKEVPTAHPTNWFFDYENGVLMFENDPVAAGLTTPFHIRVYRYIGETVQSSTASVDKKHAFLREAAQVTVSSGNSSVDVTSQMSGKTPGGNETTVGVVTSPPYNRSPILTYPDRDEILTSDGNKVFGRLTESSGTWTLSFYYVAEDGTETSYSFDSNTDIIWGYYEVLEFNDWPVFDDDAVLPSDQLVGDIPEATTAQHGKVRLAEDNETTSNEVVRADDPRAIKTTDFAMSNFNADGSNITCTIGAGVYNKDGAKTAVTNLTMSQQASTYYLIYVDLSSGTVSYSSGSSPQSAGNTQQALYKFSTDASNTVSTIEDVRPVYALSLGGGLGPLGIPTDGTYDDGLLDFTQDTQVNDAVDEINEVLKYLAPDDADPMAGDIVWSTTFTSGKISGGITLNGYLSAGSSSSHITRDVAFTGSTPNPSTSWHKADEGMLRFYRNEIQVDTFDLASNFQESEREGNQTYPPANSSNGYIRVTSVGWYNNFPLWQKGNADIRIGTTYGNSDLSVGDYKFRLGHDIDNDGTSDELTNESVIFVDPETARPGISSGPTVSENTPNLKYLSGIRFYGQNSTFDVTVTSNDKIFEYTYIDNPMRFTLTGMTTTDIAITDSSVSGVSNPPQYNEQMTITNKTVTLDQSNQYSDDGKLTATPRDPWGDGTAATESLADARLINTYGTVSTALVEEFHDEDRRLPSTYNFDNASGSLTGQWDSTQVLSNGDAQVFNGRLIYPQTNYTTGYLPAQQAGTDYSGFSGNQVYYRSMHQDGTPHSSGTLRLDGITWLDISSGDVKVEIKLPTQTGWLDLGVDYNSATFTGADGDGAMTGHSQSGNSLYIDWTAGTFSTANSGYRYFVRITLVNSSKEIDYLAETGW